jgi:hypothetical protein
MKLIKKLLAGVVVGLFTFAASTIYANDATNLTAAASSESSESLYNPFTIGAEAGTTGYGGMLNWRFLDHFGAGASIDYLGFSLNNRSIQDATYNGKLRLQSETFTFDLYPCKKSSFHVSAGVLLNQDHLTANASGVNLSSGGTTYTGNLNLDIKYQPVDPYVGIGGNVYFDSGHHFSLNGTLGVAYFGNSRVSLTSNPSDPTGTVASEKSQVQKYANDLKFFPVIKIGFNYSF